VTGVDSGVPATVAERFQSIVAVVERVSVQDEGRIQFEVRRHFAHVVFGVDVEVVSAYADVHVAAVDVHERDAASSQLR